MFLFTTIGVILIRMDAIKVRGITRAFLGSVHLFRANTVDRCKLNIDQMERNSNSQNRTQKDVVDKGLQN